MKKLHLICNAHIDPIWQWTWDEGISAAIATFKSAADLAEEFDYVFCHGEALLYETIEKNAPDLFARIQKLVKEGKWHISGGMYLQPDCLMPCGETFVRHIAVGKKYFQEKFGVEPTVATNYDSFGHSIGLVQILAKSGYKGYLICRPRKDEQIQYPSRFFRWTSPDGSSILVSNSASYSSPLGGAAEKIVRETNGLAVGMLGAEIDGAEKQKTVECVDYVLWGVGNHGGGPSRKDLRDIKNLKIEGVDIIHSTPENLFSDKIQVDGEMTSSLVTCMPGCYSSMAKVKQAYRRTENLLYATEKMLSAAILAGFVPDLKELEEAEKKLLLASFHDILPGTCIEDGEREGLGLLAASEKTLKDYRTSAFLHLVINQPSAQEGEFPIFVFNYQPVETTSLIEAEFTLADQNWRDDICYVPHIYNENGEELYCQQIKEDSTLTLDWRKRIIFEGKLKPLDITRFSVKVQATPVTKKEAKNTTIDECLYGNNLLAHPVALEMYDDTADPWGMSVEELKAIGKDARSFRLMSKKEASKYCGVDAPISPVRIIEDGEIVSTVESLHTLDNTNATLQYKLYKNQPYVDIKATVEFVDKNKVVRLKVPIPKGFENGKAVGDGPYVWEEKPHCEISFQKWIGVQNQDGQVFSISNDGLYAGKVENGYIHLTLLRGAGYCFHPIPGRELYPQDRYLPRIDCGRYVYNFRVYKGSMYEVNAVAESFNQLPYAVNVFPVGKEKTRYEGIKIEGDVILTAVKPNGQGRYIFRIYNPCEKAALFKLTVGACNFSFEVKKRGVISLIYDGGVITPFQDQMPI